MKIAIPSKDGKIDGDMDERFGRGEYFIVFNCEDNKIISTDTINNESKNESSGAGTKTVKDLYDLGVNSIIVKGEIGPKSWAVIKEFNLQVYNGKDYSSSKEAINAFLEGKLNKVEEPRGGLRRV